jgi:helicase MOV-10
LPIDVANSFTLVVETEIKPLSPIKPTIIIITLKRKDIGRYQNRVELEFEDLGTKRRFVMCRLAQAVVGEVALHKQLEPKTPYVPNRPSEREQETNVIQGVKPPVLKAISYVTSMPKPDIPLKLLSNLTQSSASSPQNVEKVQRVFLPSKLDVKTHGNHFKVLLWVWSYLLHPSL